VLANVLNSLVWFDIYEKRDDVSRAINCSLVACRILERTERMNNKKGISTIVATVLIILIVVAGVTIVWVAILPMIRDSLEFSSMIGSVSVLSSGGYTVYDADREVAIV